ncbi:MAG: SAM-dependent DNA methyltransferase [Bacteroidia bacterium]|nr:SAM-dependent DNA methyltransferase [Bacteroidia bacterium]
MFENTFKNIDKLLWKDAGCGNALDYVEQSSWILFLKYLNDYENENRDAAELMGKQYTEIIPEEIKWRNWAAPKKANGERDVIKALTGEDLIDFINKTLFPTLKQFKKSAESFKTIQYKIGEIFGELNNKVTDGGILREVLWLVDGLKFQTSEEKHEMSYLYESRIQMMGNAGKNGGEYYTPRPLIRTIVEVVKPEIGNTVYDGACGSAGFLCEAYKYLNERVNTVEDMQTLQTDSFFGREKKGLAYIIGVMNMILHGVEAPNIIHGNTLDIKLSDVQEGDKYDIILANPPFGGKEKANVQQNFSIPSSETAYLFLEHFIKHLRAGGRAGVVIKNTFLSNSDNASVALRKHLLEKCNLYAVLDLPGGTFTGAGVKTVVLFFKKGEPTQKVWFYQLNLDRNLGKTNPLSEKDLEEFLTLQPMQEESENSWSINISALDQATYDLSVKNPNKIEITNHRTPKEIAQEIETLNLNSHEILTQILKTL